MYVLCVLNFTWDKQLMCGVAWLSTKTPNQTNLFFPCTCPSSRLEWVARWIGNCRKASACAVLIYVLLYAVPPLVGGVPNSIFNPPNHPRTPLFDCLFLLPCLAGSQLDSVTMLVHIRKISPTVKWDNFPILCECECGCVCVRCFDSWWVYTFLP